MASQAPTMTLSMLKERYNAGERDFRGISVRRSGIRSIEVPGADFTAADFSGVRIDGTCDFNDCRLDDVDFSHSKINRGHFVRCSMQRVNLEGVRFRQPRFTEANLTFRKTDLREADFSRATMDGVQFFEADMSGIRLTGIDAFPLCWFEKNILDDAEVPDGFLEMIEELNRQQRNRDGLPAPAE